MRKQLTKKILVPAELPSSAIGAFFEEQGFELNFKYVEGNEYQFVVNNACPEVLNVPRLKTKPEIDEKFIPLVRCYISEDYVASLQGRKLLAGYFKEGLNFDLVDSYSKDFKNVYTVKIHEYLNVGYFTDAIIVEAYKAKFNITVLRNYLNAALNFAFKKVEVSEESMPIDVSYAHNGEAFTVMISMDVDGFEGISEMKESLEVLTENSNFFDITYFHKKNRLTLSSLLFKDKKLAMKSYFFTDIAKKSVQEENVAVAELRSGLEPHDEIKYEAQKIPDEQSKKLALARKFALFIRNYRIAEETPKKLEKLDVSDIEHYLEFYPRQSALQSVDEEIKNFIIKLLKDDQLFDGISDYIKKVASENLDSQVQEIQRILGEKSLNDIEEIIMIRGSKDEAQDVTRVKGWVEEGSDEKWEVKKGQINEKIQDEVIRINSEGRNVVQDDIIRVVAKELDAKENDIKTVVRGIVEEVVTAEMVNKQKLEEAFALKILATQTGDQVREKLESQIVRMKKIMDGLKKEIIKLQNEKTLKDTGVTSTAPEESTPEAQQLRAALLKTMEMLKGKEKMLEKMRVDYDQLSKAKDHRIEIMNQKIEELKGDFARSREFANEEKLQQLEAENKSLHARLELANKKVNIINENIENRDNEALGKREKELEALKASMQTAQSVIERFKQDKIEMENRFNEERDNNKKMREETKGSTSGVSKEELTERDAIISIMNTEKKVMEEKYRAQGMELKKLEQKLKYTLSQLETANKKNKSGSTPAAGPKSAEALTKQLDQAKAQLADTTAEMAEKRKEAIKLKQENTALTNKIAELEKKLGIADKKAS